MKSEVVVEKNGIATSDFAAAPSAQARDTFATAETDSSDNHQAHSEGVTARVIMLCLGLALLLGYVIPIIDNKMFNTYLGSTHFPPGAVAVLLAMLLVVNPLMRLLSRKWMFSRNEVLTVYMSCLFSCLVPGHAAENLLVSQMIGSFYFATRENAWLDWLQPYLKPWLSPALQNGGYEAGGRQVVESWFFGLPAGQSIPWGAWLVPLLAWGSMVFALYIMLGCLSVMLRAQWGEREALAFPLLKVPLMMTEDVDRPDVYGVLGRFFRNPIMWCGFGIAVFIQMLNGLNVYYADVPKLILELDTAPLLSEAPWNQIGAVTVAVYPLMAGLAFLLTSEVSFSLWFFFWFIKGQYLLAYFLGFQPQSMPAPIGFPPAKAFTGYQVIGAYFAYVAFVLWTGREHLKHVVRRAFGRARADDNERHEALSYPAAFWGFVLSLGFLLAWCVAAGIRWDIALAMWVAYLVMAIALTRLVVEAGLVFVSKGWAPLGTFAQLVGSGPGTWLPKESLVPASFVQSGMMFDMRGFLMPSFMQSFKLARDRGINSRRLFPLIFAVILISMSMGWMMNVRLGYETGGLQLEKWFATNASTFPAVNIAALANGAPDVNKSNWLWLGVGGFTTYAIMVARSRFLWFPLHPLGLLLNMPFAIQRQWFSLFLGWLAKTLITRYGGTDTYRKLVPAALGLVLGDVAMMLFWLIIDAWQGRSGHMLMPQ